MSYSEHGVQLNSTSGDFAEWHPYREAEAEAQPFQEGDVVGMV